jgi:predicted dehydrogenase
MTAPPLRIALVGCGQIADAHLQELRRIDSARVVAVCDRHGDLATQAAVRFGIERTYDDLARLLREQAPDVVHVTTPPHTHHAVVSQCLLAGSHVYVEKPFTSTLSEAEDLIHLAATKRRFVCLGHDQLFDPAWLECRALAASGALGDIVHVEAVQGYDLSGAFGRLLATDPMHWVHRLPGGLFQNVMSHALARVLDFLPDPSPEVHAVWFPGADSNFPTELRAMLVGRRATATIVFTSAARPAQKIARIFGTKLSLEVDLDARTVRRFRAATLPGGFAKLQLSWWGVKESLSGYRGNLGRLRRRDLSYFSGMRELFERFYRAIATGEDIPVTHADAKRATAIMEAIFDACAQRESESLSRSPLAVAAR